MNHYLDTSVLVSIIVSETRSFQAREWLKTCKENPIISDWAAVEFNAAISRLIRTQKLTKEFAAGALADFRTLRENCLPREHTHADFQLAEILIRDFETKLAGPDALHLSSTINAHAILATFDIRLFDAARLRDTPVLMPGS